MFRKATKHEMLVLYFPGKQSMLGNNCVEQAERQLPAVVSRLLVWLRSTFSPRALESDFFSSVTGRWEIYGIKATEFLLEIFQRQPTYCV